MRDDDIKKEIKKVADIYYNVLEFLEPNIELLKLKHDLFIVEKELQWLMIEEAAYIASENSK